MSRYIVAWTAVGLIVVHADSEKAAREIAQASVVVDLTEVGIKANVTTAQTVL